MLLSFAWQGCATNYHAPYRFIGSSSEDSREGIDPELHAGVQSPAEDSVEVSGPAVLSSAEQTPLASYPSESQGQPDEELSTRCALSRALEGKIEAGLALAIFLLVPNRYFKAVAMAAAPFIEDWILNGVDWLFETPSP
ncbi:MAG: hypothetical protein AB1483_05480 [Candidatus Zixiibacteriota bacterium]